VRPNFESLSLTAGATIVDNLVTWFNTGTSIRAVYGGAWNPPQLFGRLLVSDGWLPGISFVAGQVNKYVLEAPTGYMQLLTGSGLSGAAHPTFSTTRGGTTSDGAATWTCLGRSTHSLNPSNSALAVYDYLQDTNCGMGTPASAIDTASVIAAANVCEEQELIIWNPDNTVVYENLYSCNGMFDHSSTRGNVLSALLASMAGWAVPPGDAWHIFAGAYITPTIGLTDRIFAPGLKATSAYRSAMWRTGSKELIRRRFFRRVPRPPSA
jgi:hypothetical protein